jgi:hypothetical protein
MYIIPSLGIATVFPYRSHPLFYRYQKIKGIYMRDKLAFLAGLARSTQAIRMLFTVLLPLCVVFPSAAQTQTMDSAYLDLPDAPSAIAQQQDQSSLPLTRSKAGPEGEQTKRILGIVPNFESVSVDVKLPPQPAKGKFIDATKDSFDYSSFVFAGIFAGVGQGSKSVPEFHQGAAGYARYYWHTFVDQTDENYMVEFAFPVALHQDARYYTLGRGGIEKRTLYSFSRVLITRTDSGNETFNASEIVGAGAASGISDLYYPSQERTWTKTGQRWLTNVTLDGATFVLREFWPNINNALFHQK